MHLRSRVFAWWADSALIITALCVGMYSVGQQVLRQSINDTPVQLAEDTAAALEAGQAGVVPKQKVDIAASLSPFVILYDKAGNPSAGNGYLDGQLPTPPQGVFQSVDFWAHGHSWEPRSGVRVDAAIVPWSGGYVLAGRSMREMERHIEHMGALMVIGWLGTLALSLIALVLVDAFVRE